MRIVIDASRANRDRKTGVEWYSWQLIQELKKIIAEPQQVFLYTNAPLVGPLALMPPHWSEQRLVWPPRYLWTQVRLWWELIINPPDVLFVPAHTIPLLPLRKKTRIIVTVHDVGFKRFPKLYKKIQYLYHDLTMCLIARRADRIITISDFSRREMIDLYGVNSAKIAVIHLGYDQVRYYPRTNFQTTGNYPWLAEDYYLYVGRLEKKKNIINLIKAFALIYKTKPSFKLVLVGLPGHGYDEIIQTITDHNLTDAVVIAGYVPADDLPIIIARARAFIFVTLYEGFGLPILEALACGVPVITSDCDPHREVAASAAIFVNPLSVDDLADKMMAIVNQPDLAQKMVSLGLARTKEFSWHQTAEQTARILVELN